MIDSNSENNDSTVALKKKILLVGGGSGGHIYPNLALLPLLNDWNVFYVGSSKQLDKDIVANYNIPFFPIDSPKLVRGKFLTNLSIPTNLFKAVRDCKKLLKNLAPDVIFLKGGFVCLPIAIAGNSLKIPIILHESDRTLGLSNKICLPFVKKALTSFEDTKLPTQYKSKKVFVGTPISDKVLLAKPIFLFKNNKPIMLVMGGSLGSIEINNLIEENLDYLVKQYNIIHITGKNHQINQMRQSYIPIQHTSNIGSYIQTADIIISRGGANSLFEIIALKKKSLIIPLKKSSRGDQVENAKYFEAQQLITIYDDKITFLKNIEIARQHKLPTVNIFSDGKQRIMQEIQNALKN